MSKQEIPTGNADAPERRPVRSFVKRQGRITAAQKRALTELWPDYGVDFAPAALDFGTLFGRQAPVVLEIGFGNGENLVAMAKRYPDHDFFGIEVHEPGVGHCLLRIRDEALGNVRVSRHDAIEVLERSVPDESLARVNLFFPDPWHKKRHHKRRIVQPAFVDLLARKLRPGGVFHAVTDWENYAEWIDRIMDEQDAFRRLPDAPEDRIRTRFDARGDRLGHRNFERAWCKAS